MSCGVCVVYVGVVCVYVFARSLARARLLNNLTHMWHSGYGENIPAQRLWIAEKVEVTFDGFDGLRQSQNRT